MAWEKKKKNPPIDHQGFDREMKSIFPNAGGDLHRPERNMNPADLPHCRFERRIPLIKFQSAVLDKWLKVSV